MIYKGWVPTVSGQLSFSSFGESVYPTKSFTCRAGRKVVVCQRRDLLDLLVPLATASWSASFFRELIANRVIGISGDFLFLCVANVAEDQESVEGEVLVISAHKRRRECKKIVRELKAISGEYVEDLALAESISVDGHACKLLSGHFRLVRDGELKIEIDDATLGGVHSDEDIDLPRVEQEVSDQIFFFIKDLAHRHQHHNPDHDAITRSYKCETEESGDWVQKTQDALFRSVIRYKRFRSEKSLFQASGILAYAQAFKRSHEAKCATLRSYNESELALSLQIAREEMQHFDSKSISRSESTRNSFFAVFATVISAVTLAQASPNFVIDPNPIYLKVTEFVAARPLETVGIASLLSVMLNYWTNRSDPAQFEWIKDILAWCQGFRLRNFVIANLIITAALSLIAYWLLL